MDTRFLDDLNPGDRFSSPGITLTEAEIIDFALRYDPQSFHLDAVAAAESPYGGLIASGFQSLALCFRLFIQSGILADSSMGSPGIDELRWLAALRRSPGRLATHLDPGGSYRLKRTVSAGDAWRQHGAIARAMRELARVNEIANAAGTSMENVFDMINAYEAIGAIEWKPRPPRHAAPEPTKKSGLFGKLFRK